MPRPRPRPKHEPGRGRGVGLGVSVSARTGESLSQHEVSLFPIRILDKTDLESRLELR